MPPLTTAQIGRCGELLVQLRLLTLGIESAPLTTDAGIDLVAYVPGAERPITIQVKAKLAASPAGGRGALALDWWISDACPADYVAFVDLSEERFWLLTMGEVTELSQQHSGGKYHFCMYVGEAAHHLSVYGGRALTAGIVV